MKKAFSLSAYAEKDPDLSCGPTPQKVFDLISSLTKINVLSSRKIQKKPAVRSSDLVLHVDISW